VSERDALHSLHRYTRLTLLTTLPVVGAAPFLVSVGNGVRWERVVVLLAGVAVLLPVHWRRVARAIDEPTEVPPWRPSAVTLAAAFALFAYAYTYGDPGNTLWAFLPAVSVAELQFGRSRAASWRVTTWVCLGVGGATAVMAWAAPPDRDTPHPLVTAGLTAFFLVVIPFGELVALRQWRIAVELDQARRDAAELGAFRERLRFAEDLHDILGHALEVVSLKSELATRLGAVDPGRAHAEMAEVHRLARGALRDVRELAKGRRPIQLDAELAGARTLLASAGIECVVDAEPAAERHSELFGRVLREAVTNLLRHADTRRCWITVRRDALTVVNDGAATGQAGDGTGLASLSRRVTQVGGTFRAGPGEEPGTFAVEAVLAP
jgi:two-component system sensor histidine kinase DesK